MTWWLEKRMRTWARLAVAGVAAAAWAGVLTGAESSSTNPPTVSPAPATNAPAAGLPAALSGLFSEQIETNAVGAAPWADLVEIWHKTPDADASPVENLTLPIEHYENGRVRAVLHAGKAAVGRDGLIWSWQVRVDLFAATGQEDGHIEAASCLYDRNARRGYCPDNVLLVRTNTTISGVGMYWSMADQRMRIFSRPVVEMPRGARLLSGGKSK